MKDRSLQTLSPMMNSTVEWKPAMRLLLQAWQLQLPMPWRAPGQHLLLMLLQYLAYLLQTPTPPLLVAALLVLQLLKQAVAQL